MLGVDGGAAEVLVNLVTGASVADRGVVRVLGRSNADIVDGDEWLASLDRFGHRQSSARCCSKAPRSSRTWRCRSRCRSIRCDPETARAGRGAGGGVRAE